MANICENKFYIGSENRETIETISKKLKVIFTERLNGEITWEDDSFIEGYFDSKWVFPTMIFEELFDDIDDDTLYMRCLSEEYGCGYVAMNIYDEGRWRDEQTFDL